MPQIQGIKGEVVLVYCESLITQEMGYHRLSRRVNKMGLKKDIYNSSIEELTIASIFVYDHLGLEFCRDLKRREWKNVTENI
jgi:hypothetical protein